MNQFKKVQESKFEELTVQEFVGRQDVSPALKSEVISMFAWDKESVNAENGANNVKLKYSKQVEESIHIEL